MFDAQEEAYDDLEFQNVSESYELNDDDLKNYECMDS